jgi:hypothetical protein
VRQVRRRRALWLAVALVLPAAGTRAEGAGLREIVDRFDHLRVGGAVAVRDLRLAAGHMECVLESGRAAPVLAGEAVVGLFFEGRGRMEYVSVDRVEQPVVLFDVRKGTSLESERTERGIVLRDRPDRILWLARNRPLPPLSGSPAEPLEEAFRAQREKFDRVHAPPFSHDFAIHDLDAPEAPLVWAELDGGKEDLIYELGGEERLFEALVFLHASESRDPLLRRYLWPVVLSRQPLEGDGRQRMPPRFLLTDVDVELDASASRDARLVVVETVDAVGRSRRGFRFDLDDIVYAQAGTNLSERFARVRAVTDEQGRSLAFDHRRDEIIVETVEPALPGKPVRLRFEIEGDFLVQPRGDNYWELGIRPWFPQPSIEEQAYTFHAVVRVPRPFVPFAPGRTVRREQDGERNVLETRVDRPVQFAVILAGKYEVHEETRDGVLIRVATYALENPRAMEQLTNVAAEVIAYYREFLGPFPFSEFNIIEINDYGYGQAPPATMFITKEAFDPLLRGMDSIAAQGIAKTFAHEIAHQYWGIVVRIPGPEGQWLSESFAEYSAALFLRDRRGDSAYKSVYRRWRRGADYATEASPIPLANRVWVARDAVRRSEIRTGLLYDKGPLLLAALDRRLGNEAFLRFLGAYQAEFAWKFGSTSGAVDLLRKLTGEDYGPFFEKYYWGTEMPKD